jgi:hypothetical protein
MAGDQSMGIGARPVGLARQGEVGEEGLWNVPGAVYMGGLPAIEGEGGERSVRLPKRYCRHSKARIRHASLDAMLIQAAAPDRHRLDTPGLRRRPA